MILVCNNKSYLILHSDVLLFTLASIMFTNSKLKRNNISIYCLLLEQGFPAWGTCTPRGTFAYLKGYI